MSKQTTAPAAVELTADVIAATAVLEVHKDDDATAAALRLAHIEAHAVGEAAGREAVAFLSIAANLHFAPRGAKAALAKAAGVSEATVTRWARIGRVIAAQPAFFADRPDRVTAVVEGARYMTAGSEEAARKATDPIADVIAPAVEEAKAKRASADKGKRAPRPNDGAKVGATVGDALANAVAGAPDGAPALKAAFKPADLEARTMAVYDAVAALIAEAAALTGKARTTRLKALRMSLEGLTSEVDAALSK